MKFGLDAASAIAAISFANRFNIPILNASWGGRGYSRALKDAIEHYNGLFIASAGNSAEDNDITPVYPASYDCDNIISVAATTPDDTLARFSNYGAESVDLAAPGTDILSLGLQREYSTQNGTSMAAPHVAGAAALLKSYLPNLTTSDLKDIILSSAVKTPYLAGKVSTGGMLNVHAMFERMNRLRRSSI
ncbi:S8 family serine peptidase [Clostridium sp. D33t1_170424_F3]|uniref:S8 family serine peptidase n=1 Tax=Clostridium sp. D33t1_170424_F3 TaxID=2787099 RepID=UPI001A9BFDE9|nr:S8 family serine peptidase [Clostridium sp. D33t1_170424_F3]